MINYMVERKLKAFEKTTGESADYMRDLLRHSSRGFFLFMLFMPLTAFKGGLSKEVYHIARLATIRHEDCGPCLQTVVTMAALDGVDPKLIQAILKGDSTSLPKELATVEAFAKAVLERALDMEELKSRIIAFYGEKAVTELALVIASVRVYPVVKRAMGYAKSCSLVRVSVPGN